MSMPDFLCQLRDKTGLYVKRDDYHQLVAFIDGCDFALHGNLLLGFREWLLLIYGKESSYDWNGIVVLLCLGEEKTSPSSTDDHRIAIKTLFKYLEEYFDFRSSQQGLARIFYDYEIRRQDILGRSEEVD